MGMERNPKQQEIQDSLEFCKDIELYYKPTKQSKILQESNLNLSTEQKHTCTFLNSMMISDSNPPDSQQEDLSQKEEGEKKESKRQEKKKEKITRKEEVSHWETKPFTPEEELAAEQEELFAILQSGSLSSFHRILYKIGLFVGYFLLAFVAARLFFLFIAQETIVEGISMENTLENGDVLIVDKLTYRFHSPERFDIIVFPFEKGVYYIKRIIGLPGETVQIIEGEIYINGERLKEEFGNEKILYSGIAEEPFTLGEEEYFVMGDNRNRSLDSRYEAVGAIHRKNIIGKAIFRIFPFHQIGTLKE